MYCFDLISLRYDVMTDNIINRRPLYICNLEVELICIWGYPSKVPLTEKSSIWLFRIIPVDGDIIAGKHIYNVVRVNQFVE